MTLSKIYIIHFEYNTIIKINQSSYQFIRIPGIMCPYRKRSEFHLKRTVSSISKSLNQSERLDSDDKEEVGIEES